MDSRRFLVVFLILLSACGFAQGFSAVDKVMQDIPDSLTVSTQKIADYITQNFNTESEKVRAAFYWTAANISYDLDNRFAINFNESEQEQIQKTLLTKKGICMHYARVFNDIANKSGVKSLTVEGYTMQNGFTDYIPHLWCAANVDGKWYVFDPTWGSGYISRGKFVKKYNGKYYKANPSSVIETHMPFDYLFQFSNFPVTNQEFYDHKTQIDRSKTFYDYESEISKYEAMDEIRQLEAATARIEANGVKNAMIFDRLAWKKRQLDYLKMKRNMDDYNKISTTYNEAINEINELINFRNKKFKPEIPDAALKAKIDSPKAKLTDCKEKLARFVLHDKNNQAAVDSLQKAVDMAISEFAQHENFVAEYLKAPKATRKLLFYKKM